MPATSPKTALITGITGQDGSYLAEFLLEKGYRVYGMVRRSSSSDCHRIAHLLGKIDVVSGDLGDMACLIRRVQAIQPVEVYNLAAQSFVPLSWEEPILTSQVTGMGVMTLLEAIRIASPRSRFYQASSSEMFGNAPESPQSERTPFHPRSPYAVSKVFGHWVTVNYRESFNLFTVSGILFNHESPRRGEEFVTRKVTRAAARIKLGLQDKLHLGNLNARRDWGFAGDYVRAMWSMLQLDAPEDFVIATGVSHSVRDLVQTAFDRAGIRWEEHVVPDASLQRPAEVNHLIGDASKARQKLGWRPEVDFHQLIHRMVDHDLQLAAEERTQGGSARARVPVQELTGGR